MPLSQLYSPALENTIIVVPNFATGGVVVQKVSPGRRGSGEPLDPLYLPLDCVWAELYLLQL